MLEPSPRCRRLTAFAVLLAFALPFTLATALRAGQAPPAMFVTSTTGNGDFSTNGTWVETEGTGLTGFAAADKICQVRAEASGLASGGSPIYRAWVSIGVDDAYCHVQGLTGNKGNSCNNDPLDPSPGPYYRRDSVPFADSFDALANGILGTPTDSELSTFVAGIAWTGSNADGTATGSTCSGWNSAVGSGSIGSSSSESGWSALVGGGTVGCSFATGHLYCFQDPVPSIARQAWTEPAAIVFTREIAVDGGFGLVDGLAAADADCRSEAEAAGLPDPQAFVAWLSDTNTDAKDRLTTDGPFYRVDGVRVAQDKAALTDGNLDSALSRQADGVRVSGSHRVWTGTLTSGTKATNRCVDWTSVDVNDQGVPGDADNSGSSWSTAGAITDFCSTLGRFYCFSNTIVLFWDPFETGDVSRWTSNVGFVP